MSLIDAGIKVVVILVLMALLWHCITNTFYGKLFYYRLFKLRSISGKTSVSPDGWTKAENTLGGDFKKFIPAVDRAEFDNSKIYLRKAGDLGRTPLPFWLIAVIGILIIAEGLGFSYLLGAYIAPEGTADTYTLMMVAIVLVLCVVLGVLTHAAGHQLYRTRLVKDAHRDWQETRADHKQTFMTRDIDLSQDQGIDDAEPRSTQLANRVGDKGQYTMMIIAVFTIMSIAVLSTNMRMKGHEKAMADHTMGKPAASAAAVGNPFAGAQTDGLPAAVTQANDSAGEKAAQEADAADKDQALSAFIILAVIFVITQIVAIYAGFKWGFGGKESGAAYARTRGFASWTEVREVKEAFIEPVEELMTALHAKFSDGNRKIAVHDFKQYLAKKTPEAAGHDESVPPVPPTEPAKPAAAQADVPESLQSHLEAIDALVAKQDKESYVLKLAPTVRAQVIEAIKARQLRETEAMKEVEGLF